MSDGAVTGLVDARAVRVFVSSTFRDMQAERDELVRHVFPQLRTICESRDVAWAEVDLRWGITNEQRSEGKVLPICLAEIEQSRPYFIGLLGERYGWVPDEIEAAATGEHPWLAAHPRRSVTEIEILHGVLNDPAMAHHAYFYFRDPAFIDTVRPEEQANYRELGEENRLALAKLKARIRASGFPVREDYPNPATLGQMVLADFTALIDSLFPAGSELPPFERERKAQRRFGAARARGYVSDGRQFDSIDDVVAGKGPPLTLIGEAGAGKSALLAAWLARYEATHPDAVIVSHFAGATPASTDWRFMLRRILTDLHERLDRRLTSAIPLPLELPTEPEALRAAFASRLLLAGSGPHTVVVIDGLDHLNDVDQALDLAWLPLEIRPGVRLILSTSPGRPLKEVLRRGWPTQWVDGLNPAEREQLIVDYLRQYKKELDPARRSRIVSARGAASPLFTRTVLEELRLWGDHDTLDLPLDRYVSVDALDDLYDLILERWEQDYERDRPGLVRDLMTWIGAARWGLTEAELSDLLGGIPRAHWSPLYLALQSALVNRSGLLSFGYHDLRRAVERRYTATSVAKERAHRHLARYFSTRPLDQRRVNEQPWQLVQAGEWEGLAQLLTQPDFMRLAWTSDAFEVKSWWAEIETNSAHRLADAYRPAVEQPDRYETAYLWDVAMLLGDTGHHLEALRLWIFAADGAERTGDLPRLVGALNNQGTVLRLQGELEAAMRAYARQEAICRDRDWTSGLQASLGNQAVVLLDMHQPDAAMEAARKQEVICRDIGDAGGLAAALGNQGLAHMLLGEYDAALARHRQHEEICRRIGDRDGLSRALRNQALATAKARPDR